MSDRPHVHTMEPLDVPEREVGIWLWAMEEARRGLIWSLRGIEQDELDWRGPIGRDNSIGTLLTHIAGVEMGWCYFDVHGEPFPPELIALFPYENDREPDGTLVHVEGQSLETHLERLGAVRRSVFERFAHMDLDDWHRLREPQGEDYAMSPAWTVYHLLEHEAGHTYEIRAIRRRWRQATLSPIGP
ncbi:MAG TPA: DinB family protein [Trueperaceae bacterium]|nr:DinB family protein [Trueperaceae bacterium]